jgi:phage shock protein E
MVLIDVRTASEYNNGHYLDAINHELDLMTKGVLPDFSLDTDIQIYCRSGARAAVAKNILEQHGFTHVTNIGGYSN